MGFLWFCAAGYSFFVGALILSVAALVSALIGQPRIRLLAYGATVIAAFFIYLSAAPIGWWFYVIWALVALEWLVIMSGRRRRNGAAAAAVGVMAVSLAAVMIELPFFVKPAFPKSRSKQLYVIGDSVSAASFESGTPTWPQIVRDKHSVKVIDLSRSGATVKTAIRQAEQIEGGDGLVLVEIGGNDIFERTPLDAFERDLRRIIRLSCDRKRTVAMLELPVFPCQSGYGRIQRKLATEFDVIVIPKRFFVRVLSAKGASIDLAHLSPSGHEMMAETIWSLMKDSVEGAPSLTAD